MSKENLEYHELLSWFVAIDAASFQTVLYKKKLKKLNSSEVSSRNKIFDSVFIHLFTHSQIWQIWFEF